VCFGILGAEEASSCCPSTAYYDGKGSIFKYRSHTGNLVIFVVVVVLDNI
jgi:hypothetical protein